LLLVLSSELYSIIYYGEVPVYGIHPDPTSLGTSWIMALLGFPAMMSFFAVPAFILTGIHLAINKVRIRQSDKISLTVFTLSILSWILLINDNSGFFEWLMN